jgi:RIO kinase 2
LIKLSSAQIAAKAIKQLEPEDIDALKGLEKSYTRYEAIPLENLRSLLGLSRDKLLFRLSKLNAFGFVIKTEHGYTLVSAGLDALALHFFVQKGLISGMGRAIGMGKESDVFEVTNDSGDRAVIKFYRIGRTSFRATQIKRSYSTPASHQWLEINIDAARKEEEGLKKAIEAKVLSPKFIARNRHAVLMQEIDGVMLHACGKEEIADPKSLAKQILGEARKAYVDAKMINGDLSEYNILFDGEKPWIIDWPQYVLTDHPNAAEIMERDVKNTLLFFRRKFGEDIGIENALAYTTGKTDLL